MIVIPIKEGEHIERALKKFKRKFEKTGVIKELRERQVYTKPSVKQRQQKLHAVYVQKMQQEEE
jgi:small subunit ribosomal protein S21